MAATYAKRTKSAATILLLTIISYCACFTVFSTILRAEKPKKPTPEFSFENVKILAEKLAHSPYKDRYLELKEKGPQLNYEEYRDIRFRPDKAIWAKEKTNFQLQLFAPGGLYNRPVDIYLIENGNSNKLKFTSDLFDFGKIISASKPDFIEVMKKISEVGQSLTEPKALTEPSGKPGITFSGFRIHHHINNRKNMDEFTLFQGASYFRATAKNQNYGLSARGLAINTGTPQGEEFPYFRSFWIQKPGRKAKSITVFALLDSPSLAGAYKFKIQPGKDTVMDVDLTLYPRKEVTLLGLAPLTSMFQFNGANTKKFDDFRPAVHDSEGLSILNGKGEWLWRPLRNASKLQVSSFMDENPKGFGLIQRNRDFENYQDLEARYDLRPSLWIVPKGQWGKGAVELLEIPTNTEIHDNIVAFWRPDTPLKPGVPITYSYTMYWGTDAKQKDPMANVTRTMSGKADDNKHRYIVEFSAIKTKKKRPSKKDKSTPSEPALPEVAVSSSAGQILDKNIQLNPVTGGLRASFVLDPQGAENVDLRLNLLKDGKPISEVFIYRWTDDK